MEELEVTRLWMAGVVGVMFVFAAAAVIGYIVKQRRDQSEIVKK